MWANGEGLREVFIVYILLVRNLQAARYHGQDDCFHSETLATAVVCENFP